MPSQNCFPGKSKFVTEFFVIHLAPLHQNFGSLAMASTSQDGGSSVRKRKPPSSSASDQTDPPPKKVSRLTPAGPGSLPSSEHPDQCPEPVDSDKTASPSNEPAAPSSPHQEVAEYTRPGPPDSTDSLPSSRPVANGVGANSLDGSEILEEVVRSVRARTRWQKAALTGSYFPLFPLTRIKIPSDLGWMIQLAVAMRSPHEHRKRVNLDCGVWSITSCLQGRAHPTGQFHALFAENVLAHSHGCGLSPSTCLIMCISNVTPVHSVEAARIQMQINKIQPKYGSTQRKEPFGMPWFTLTRTKAEIAGMKPSPAGERMGSAGLCPCQRTGL
jgi:hypothetical protein